jgi:hypothetical protein
VHTKYLTAALAACSLAVGMTGVASAGEISGKSARGQEASGKTALTPVNGYRAASICSFSGLNDAYIDPEQFGGDPADEAMHTQTPKGAGGAVVGFACNPTRSQE